MLLDKLTYGDKPVRINIDSQGEPWFCLSDVGDVLGIKNPRDFLNSDHCIKEGVETFYTPTPSGDQEMAFINEANLYALIFRSSKPEAKSFRQWVFTEVLPTIRKTGSYDTGIDLTDPIMVMAKTALDLRRHQVEQERRLAEHDQRLAAIEASQQQSRQNLAALPAPTVELDELPMIKNCRLAVDDLVSLTGNGHHAIWTEAYKQYDLRQSVNLTKRIERYNEGKRPKDKISKLAYVEKFGDINVLYSILLQMARKAKLLSA